MLPAKVVLLAAHFTATGDIASLSALAAQHRTILSRDLLLRLLLTYLPAHLPTAAYLPVLETLATEDSASESHTETDNRNNNDNNDDDEFSAWEAEETTAPPPPPPLPTSQPTNTIDTSSVDSLSDKEAAKKARKLYLRQWLVPEGLASDDALSAFLIQRAYAVDEGAGALQELPGLVAPFLARSTVLQTWAVSTLLPYLRRYWVYYGDSTATKETSLTLYDFAHLGSLQAVAKLLSMTAGSSSSNGDSGEQEGPTYHPAFPGRDLRGLIGPWLYNAQRWPHHGLPSSKEDSTATTCPGYEWVLQWLTTQAASNTSWHVAVHAVQQWDGPVRDVDLGFVDTASSFWQWTAEEETYLRDRYVRAALACAYRVPEASFDALSGVQGLVSKAMSLLDHDPIPPLSTAADLLSPVLFSENDNALLSPRNATYLRNDLLDEGNPLTSPTADATTLLHALVISAFLLTRFASTSATPSATACTVRGAGELALLQSEREQKAAAAQAIRQIASHGPKGEDKYWIKARNEILWLRDWGAEEVAGGATTTSTTAHGVFGQVKRDFIEIEFLKALLTNTRYSLARKLYEDAADAPLAPKLVQDTVYAAAMKAYDSASNPNRTRGGLKKCDEIIHAFPKTMHKDLPARQRTEALLAATHSLSEYSLVLRQGEPFTPVVLRVHSDPLSIVGKVLEQNPQSYTRLQDLVRLGTALVDAGLAEKTTSSTETTATTTATTNQRALAERRVIAMCIDAALREDDFETAYSYVVSRLAALESELDEPLVGDIWSWRAALDVGKYRRTAQTLRPSHLGTATANLDIRHLEQRIECLAVALRMAPASTLQEILNAYRRCEEELETAVKQEQEQEQAWDDAGDWSAWQSTGAAASSSSHKRHSSSAMPGGFDEAQFAALNQTSSSHSNKVPLASRMAANASSSVGAAASASSRSSRLTSSANANDEAPLSLFDLSRATARAAQRNLTALSSLRQTRQLNFGGLGSAFGGVGSAAAGMSASGSSDGRRSEDGGSGGLGNSFASLDGVSTSSGHHGQAHRKRDQLRDAAMGTLTSGVGWLIGAQPVDRNNSNTERDHGI